MSAVSGTVFEGDDRQYALTRLSGWLELVFGPERVQPPRLTRRQMGELSELELTRYQDLRAVWHANLGPIKTPQMIALHEALTEIVDSNRQDGDKAKPAALLDAYPGIGKSTAIREYARNFHREQVRLHGQATPEGHRRVPVVYVNLTGNTQIRGLNASICRFYGLPTSGDADTLAERAVDAVLSMRTAVFVIDDVHFLAPGKSSAVRMANHLKFLSNVFPVTLLYVGVGVADRGILREGLSPQQALLAQFGRRTTALTLRPFQIDDDQGRKQWRVLLKTIEKKIVLAEKHPGMLVDLADYLFARTTGHFASLMALVNRSCLRAVRSGEEKLDKDLIDTVKNDAAAEEARRELEAAIEAGLLSARPGGPARKRRSA
ncbi:AAA family ATPase [Streptomyces sp. NPDC015220]|uniref:AAA family ATPase n=1 Tax=Streptomyces sp. NPDC015220 TaxID=3364947 RepID=UPI0036FA17C7